MSVFSITNNNYHEEVVTSGKPVLLDFWAPWCGPCKKLSPVVDKIAELRGLTSEEVAKATSDNAKRLFNCD